MNGKLSPLFPPPAGNAVNTTSRRRRGHVIGLTALFTNGPRLKRGYFDALKDDTHGLMPAPSILNFTSSPLPENAT